MHGTDRRAADVIRQRQALALAAHQITLQTAALREFRRRVATLTDGAEIKEALDQQIAEFEAQLATNASTGQPLHQGVPS